MQDAGSELTKAQNALTEQQQQSSRTLQDARKAWDLERSRFETTARGEGGELTKLRNALAAEKEHSSHVLQDAHKKWACERTQLEKRARDTAVEVFKAHGELTEEERRSNDLKQKLRDEKEMNDFLHWQLNDSLAQLEKTRLAHDNTTVILSNA